MNFEDALFGAQEKDAMHRMIDELPEDSFAILAVQNNKNSTVNYSSFGNPKYTQVLGLLTYVIHNFFRQNFPPHE